jgi:hypothetical protein
MQCRENVAEMIAKKVMCLFEYEMKASGKTL